MSREEAELAARVLRTRGYRTAIVQASPDVWCVCLITPRSGVVAMLCRAEEVGEVVRRDMRNRT